MLFNQITGQSHPLQWQAPASAPSASPSPCWQLPAIAHLSPPAGDYNWNIDQAQITLPPGAPSLADGLLLCDLKLALDIGLPYVSPELGEKEPRLDWYFRPVRPQRSLFAPPSVALGTILQALAVLLASFKPSPPDGLAESSAWRCLAPGLGAEQVHAILNRLEGIVVNSPSHCSEAYHFNLREGILAAGLVARPEQIVFLEEPIAALLAEFHPHHRPRFDHSQWQGGTLVIHTTETTTELAVVCLPDGLHNLSHDDIQVGSLAYGGRSYCQDIACQLLYPLIPEQQIDLDLAVLPLPGEADPEMRSQLQRALYRSPAGPVLLEAAAQLNRVLQTQAQLTFEFGPHRCRFSQTALDTKVTQPFLLRLNREINHLLAQSGLSGESITQVICSGDPTTRPAILHWLAEKLPQARIVDDTLNPETPAKATPGDCPSYLSHRLAYGLASLPLYPQVLDRSAQQYSGYFLLLELLRCLPDEALTVAEILNHLEARGIHTQSCQSQIKSILAGRLPAGLIPQATDDLWVLESRQNPDYPALQAPLFRALSDQSFQVDPAQRSRFWHYWQQIAAQSQQSLEEPYSLQVGLSLSETWTQ